MDRTIVPEEGILEAIVPGAIPEAIVLAVILVATHLEAIALAAIPVATHPEAIVLAVILVATHLEAIVLAAIPVATHLEEIALAVILVATHLEAIVRGGTRRGMQGRAVQKRMRPDLPGIARGLLPEILTPDFRREATGHKRSNGSSDLNSNLSNDHSNNHNSGLNSSLSRDHRLPADGRADLAGATTAGQLALRAIAEEPVRLGVELREVDADDISQS